ncbi:ring zinc finger transcriptional negative regulator [Nucleospora cyclopteri]
MNQPVVDFFNVRVIQKSLVYIVGIPLKYASDKILVQPDFFGQFGQIKKIIVNTLKNNSACAYITYSNDQEAKWCIQEIDESILEGRTLRSTYGTTKYCTFYLKNVPCQNLDCMYLHELRPSKDILTKEELCRTKLHSFESKNRNVEIVGKRRKFDFIEELIQLKRKEDFKPPRKIKFEPIDFNVEFNTTTFY